MYRVLNIVLVNQKKLIVVNADMYDLLKHEFQCLSKSKYTIILEQVSELNYTIVDNIVYLACTHVGIDFMHSLISLSSVSTLFTTVSCNSQVSLRNVVYKLGIDFTAFMHSLILLL